IDFSFFFSSRRRHTRSTRDWSSDVCSSDLSEYVTASFSDAPITHPDAARFYDQLRASGVDVLDLTTDFATLREKRKHVFVRAPEIGRASCRERVQMSEVAVPRIRKSEETDG